MKKKDTTIPDCHNNKENLLTAFPPERWAGGQSAVHDDNKCEGGGDEITELWVMRMCTMRDDENVNTAVVGFSWIQTRS